MWHSGSPSGTACSGASATATNTSGAATTSCASSSSAIWNRGPADAAGAAAAAAPARGGSMGGVGGVGRVGPGGGLRPWPPQGAQGALEVPRAILTLAFKLRPAKAATCSAGEHAEVADAGSRGSPRPAGRCCTRRATPGTQACISCAELKVRTGVHARQSSGSATGHAGRHADPAAPSTPHECRALGRPWGVCVALCTMRHVQFRRSALALPGPVDALRHRLLACCSILAS